MIKEYECKNCGKVIEVWDRFDIVPEKCTICGGEVKKIISKTTFQLKGSGWYITEYKNKTKGKGE